MTTYKRTIAYLLVLSIAIFLRFLNYPNHWGLAVDQVHDALVARHILDSGRLPLLGPFSSAGPFQMAGWWYWFIAAATAIYPASIITPWVVLTLMYVFFVYLSFRFGEELLGFRFGLILALYSAVSTGQVAQSVNLTNQSPLALTSLLAIWNAVRYLRTGRPSNLFFLGFFVSLGASIHLQGAALILFILTILVFKRKFVLKDYLALFIGCIIPVLTILIYDINNNFDNIRGMSQYYFFDKYKISLDVLGRRWLTYIGIFWPVEWARIVSGNKYFAGIIAVIAYCWAGVQLIRRKIDKSILSIFLGLLLAVALIKGTRTPLFSSYLVFLHPFVLIVTAWISDELWKKNFRLGVVLVASVVILTGYVTYMEDMNSTNNTYKKSMIIKDLLYKKYPGRKFYLFDYKYVDALYSLTVSILMHADKRLSANGVKIAFGYPGNQIPKSWKPFLLGDDLPKMVEINDTKDTQLRDLGWIWVNPRGIYTEAIDWKSNQKKR